MFGKREPVTEEQVREALRAVIEPQSGRDIVALDCLREVTICGGNVAVKIELNTPAPPVKNTVKARAQEVLSKLPGVERAEVRIAIDLSKQPPPPPREAAGPAADSPIPGVKATLAVASGKGGVGKSTVAANLAVALRQLGARVGLLDADVYGPSVPTMFGVDGGVQLRVNERELIEPLEIDGVKLFSIGFLVEREAAMIMRGPMLAKYVNDGLGRVDWGELDVLVIDLPPGTGDVQLTLGQTIPVTGAVIVTTPQRVALADVRRAITACERLNVPVVGILENMSDPLGADGERVPMFGHGGGRAAATEWGLPYLGEVRFDPQVPVSGDGGTPIVAAQPGSEVAELYRGLAERLLAELGGGTPAQPSLSVVD